MRTSHRLLAVFAGLVVSPAFAAMNIGSGSSVNFADAAVNLGCSDLTIAGQATATAAAFSAIANLGINGGGFAPGASQISLGGSFSNAGTFSPGTSRLSIVDTCGVGISQVSGATSFYDLVVGTTTGKQLVLSASMTQSVVHGLALQGVAGNLLQVLSSTAGQRALLAVSPNAIQTIAYVNVRDNNASAAPIAPGTSAQYNSLDSGNLVNWFVSAVTNPSNAIVPAPVLGRMGRIGLLSGVLIGAGLALRRRQRTSVLKRR